MPVDVSIGATDSGKLKVLDKNGEEVRVSTMITVDQAPSPRGAIPTTIIYDDGALAQASSDWWRFFKEPEGGFAASATWDRSCGRSDTNYYGAALPRIPRADSGGEGAPLPADDEPRHRRRVLT